MNMHGRNAKKFGMQGRYTLRLTPDLNRDLNQLGRLEKRRVAELVRGAVANALADWRKTHPGTNPSKPRKKRKCKSTPINS